MGGNGGGTLRGGTAADEVPRLGGAGGTGILRSGSAGLPNLGGLLSIGALGGLGGGGGAVAGVEVWMYFPASGTGGGALRRGRGGEGSLGGDGVGSRGGEEVSGLPFRMGGGGGGTPRFPVSEFCGLIVGAFVGGGAEGGGGGGALIFLGSELTSPSLCSLACFCSMYFLIKSECLAISSSVIPISKSSSNIPFHEGSTVSNGEDCDIETED